jgi:hypothetical protein
MYYTAENLVNHAADSSNTSATRATTPAPQGRLCQNNKGNDASTKRVMMPVQLTEPARQQPCQRNEGNNTDKVVDAAVECGYKYLMLQLYAN